LITLPDDSAIRAESRVPEGHGCETHGPLDGEGVGAFVGGGVAVVGGGVAVVGGGVAVVGGGVAVVGAVVVVVVVGVVVFVVVVPVTVAVTVTVGGASSEQTIGTFVQWSQKSPGSVAPAPVPMPATRPTAPSSGSTIKPASFFRFMRVASDQVAPRNRRVATPPICASPPFGACSRSDTSRSAT
jgi:hypothetical protein